MLPGALILLTEPHCLYSDAVPGEVKVGVAIRLPVITSSVFVVGIIVPDGLVDDSGLAMVVLEDAAVAIGTNKQKSYQMPRNSTKA